MVEHRATIKWRRIIPDFPDGGRSRHHTWHDWEFDGGAVVAASSSPHVVPTAYSNPAFVDPEEALVASISSCHMLTYIFLASAKSFVVEAYEDEAVGLMTKNQNGVPWISAVTLHPKIVCATGKQPLKAQEGEMHHHAHEQCFITNSVKTKITVAEPD